jgi:16S rRNA (cytosine967-C5)-methyltransferase
VNTAVALAGGRRETERFKGLVNAVLRAVGRDGEPPVETYAPDWLHQRWRATYGEAAALALGAVIPQEPPTDVSAKGDAARMAEVLDARVLPTDSIRTGLRGDVAGWPRYAEGEWWVQDAAAALPARLLDVQAEETVLDLCAAPGGKTMQLAASGARVTALDRSASRLRRLNENLARTGLTAATAWEDAREFDAVLLDAPCTATGTFRRHPDVLWAARPSDVAPLAAMQAKLLDAAARRVRPGGRLVYCTCSLEPEEGEAQVAAFLARSPEFARSPIASGEAGSPAEAITADRDLRLLPSMWADQGGLDGFFISRLVRT